MATGVDRDGTDALTAYAVTMNGIAHAAAIDESLGFLYGTQPGVYDQATPHLTLGDTTANQAFSEVVNGLDPNTRYYWVAVIYNAADEIIFQSGQGAFFTSASGAFCMPPCTANEAIPIPGVIPPCVPVCVP